MIKVFLSGKVTNNMQLQESKDGVKYLHISLISMNHKGQGDKKKYDHVNIVCFGDMAQTHAQNLKKGSLISAACRLKPNKFMDAAGRWQKNLSLVCEEIEYNFTPEEESVEN